MTKEWSFTEWKPDHPMPLLRVDRCSLNLANACIQAVETPVCISFVHIWLFGLQPIIFSSGQNPGCWLHLPDLSNGLCVCCVGGKGFRKRGAQVQMELL